MAQRRHHYECAFEHHLRSSRIPYVAVNEARKALLPPKSRLTTTTADQDPQTLKNFDFVIYGDTPNLLIEIKGRKLPEINPRKDGSLPRARLETWVTMDDIDSFTRWQKLFGDGYEAVFVFVYWCPQTPPDGLFNELIEYQGRWYTLRAITLNDYTSAMRVRSPRWRTVHLLSGDFDRLSGAFAPTRFGSDPALIPAFDPLGEDNHTTESVFA